MKRIEVKGEKSTSAILVGESLLNLRSYIPTESVFIITDSNVERLYRTHFPKFPVFVMKPGEAHKNLSTAETIYRVGFSKRVLIAAPLLLVLAGALFATWQVSLHQHTCEV